VLAELPASPFNKLPGGLRPLHVLAKHSPGERPALIAEPRPLGRTPPHSPEAERYLISCCLLDGDDVLARCLAEGLKPSDFYTPGNRVVFEELLKMRAAGQPCAVEILVENLDASGTLPAIGGNTAIVEMTKAVSSSAQSGHWIASVKAYAQRRAIIHAAWETLDAAYDAADMGSDDLLAFAKGRLDRIEASQPGTERNDKLWAEICARSFQVEQAIPQPPARFLIDGKGVCTPDNLTSVIAQAKAGKSAFISAMLAAVFLADAKERGIDLPEDFTPDTLAVTAAMPEGLPILHIDTEQSPADHDRSIRRALKRAGLQVPPPGFSSLRLAGLSTEALRRALREILRRLCPVGKAFAVFIDGGADFVANVNDPDESKEFVAELMSLATTYHCPIITVVHENPGNPENSTGKMRGHFGSELERKAESNIRLRKDRDGITVVFAEKMRGAPISEDKGPRFQWSDGAGMHVSTSTKATTRDDKKRESMREEAEAVFQDAGAVALTWSQLRDGAAKMRGIEPKGGIKRFELMKGSGVISKDEMGLWRLKP